MRGKHLAGAGFKNRDCLPCLGDITRHHGTRDQNAVDPIIDGYAMRMTDEWVTGKRSRNRLEGVSLRISHDDVVRAHTRETLGSVVLRKYDIFLNTAAWSLHHLHPVGKTF